MGFDPISTVVQGAGAIGGLMGKKGEADVAREQQAMKERAFQQAIARGEKLSTEGENQFLETANSENPYLKQVGQDIQAGGTEAMQNAQRQMQANLAQQGVRGGKAATLLARGTGDIASQTQRDLTQSQSQDLANKQMQKMAYFQSKAGRGQSGMLSPVAGPA